MLTLAFFLLLDGGQHVRALTARLAEPQRARIRRVGDRIARIVRSYVIVNLLLAALAGIFTWLAAGAPRRRPRGPAGGARRRSSTWCR